MRLIYLRSIRKCRIHHGLEKIISCKTSLKQRENRHVKTEVFNLYFNINTIHKLKQILLLIYKEWKIWWMVDGKIWRRLSWVSIIMRCHMKLRRLCNDCEYGKDPQDICIKTIGKIRKQEVTWEDSHKESIEISGEIAYLVQDLKILFLFAFERWKSHCWVGENINNSQWRCEMTSGITLRSCCWK